MRSIEGGGVQKIILRQKLQRLSLYRHTFVSENFSFFLPKRDLYDVCHIYANSSSEEKLQEQYKKHKEDKLLARIIKNVYKKKAKEDASICAAVFYLQQLLAVLKTEVGLVYYMLCQKGITKFQFFPDICPGQNRNKFIFPLCTYLTQNYSIKFNTPWNGDIHKTKAMLFIV